MFTDISPADATYNSSAALYLAICLFALISAGTARLSPVSPKRILDVACGYARVNRALNGRFPEALSTVSDLMPM